MKGSPEMLEVKMGTEGFSNSGNEGSDENRDSADRDHNEDSNQVSFFFVV